MDERGYPVDGDDRRLADASLEHPDVMDHFRIATPIAADARADSASPDRLRQAMVHYRELFSRLLGVDAAADAASTDASEATETDAPDAADASTDGRAETPETFAG